MQLTILRCGEEADFSFCKRLWELSLHQVGARQDGDELPDQRGDGGGDGDGVDGGDDGDHLGEQGGEDQPEEFVEEFQFRSPLGWFVGNCSSSSNITHPVHLCLIVSTFGVPPPSQVVQCKKTKQCQTLPSTTSPLST